MTRPAKIVSGSGGSLMIAGEIDIVSRDDVVSFVRDALGRGTTDVVALDMSGVTFIDCAGLGGLLQARSLAADSGRSLRAIELSRPVRRLFELTDTLSILTR